MLFSVDAMILLSRLFVYDIWWVFGTDVVSGVYICKIEQILTVTWESGVHDARVRGYCYTWTVHCQGLHCDMTMIEREVNARHISMERLWDSWDLLCRWRGTTWRETD